MLEVKSAGANTATSDPTWTDPVELAFERSKRLHVHIIACDWQLGAGTLPLADAVFPLEEALRAEAAPKVERYQMQALLQDRATQDATLVAQWGSPRPRYTGQCTIVRAEGLPAETVVVEARVLAPGSGCILASARSYSDPQFHYDVELQCDDEGDALTMQFVVLRTRFGLTEEPIGELAKPLRRAEFAPGATAKRLKMQPLGGAMSGGQLTVAFGNSITAAITIRPSSVAGVDRKEDSWSFDPFVRARVVSQDPRNGLQNVAVLAEGQTEVLKSCTGDPHWEEPITLKVVPEPGLFLHLVVCDWNYLGAPDELADFVMGFDEARALGKSSLLQKYPLQLRVPNRRHADPAIFLSFNESGAAVSPATGTETVGSASGSAPAHGVLLPGGATGSTSPCAGAWQPGMAPGACAGSAGSSSPPPLSQLLQAHGAIAPGGAAMNAPSHIPVVSLPGVVAPSPPGWVAMPSTFGVAPAGPMGYPQGTAFAIEAQRVNPNDQQERAALESVVRQRGGVVRGVVPMSFFSDPSNPHSMWLHPSGGGGQ